MKWVVVTGPGELELRWTWLPTFIGLNAHFKKEMEKELSPLLVGKDLTEETLRLADTYVVDFICRRYAAIPGLRDYLDGLKFVAEEST